MSFRRLPPWIFTSRARTDQLVCDPRSYVRAWQADGRPLWAPCLSWAPGPATLASTGDGTYPTLFGQNWLLQICDDGSWVLYQRQGTEDLVVIPWDVVPPTAGITTRHPTLAFDQAARPAMAWEEDDGIRLREYDEVNGAYHFIGPFAGTDPVLLCDATVNYHVAGSDVVLFYLSEDRLTLRYRVQNENFLIEHDHATLSAATILDAPDIGGYRFQLRKSDDTGKVTESGDTFEAILSDVYPIYVQDDLNVGVGALADGMYQLVVIKRQPAPDHAVGAVAALADGVLLSVILHQAGSDRAVGAVGAFADGVLFYVIIPRGAVIESAVGAVASFADGALLYVIIQRNEVVDAITGGVGSLGDGAYAAA